MSKKPNLYIALFHGRNAPDDELDDWGLEGPVIGPIRISWTYGNVKVVSPDETDFEHLPERDDLVVYDGKFYGDFEVMVEGDPRLEQRTGGRPFHTYERFQSNAAAANKGRTT